MIMLIRLLKHLLDIVSGLIVIYCILTWIAPKAWITNFLKRVIEPFAVPFRSLAMYLVDKLGLPIDLTYLFTLIAIRIVERLLTRIMYMLY